MLQYTGLSTLQQLSRSEKHQGQQKTGLTLTQYSSHLLLQQVTENADHCASLQQLFSIFNCAMDNIVKV